MICFLMIFSLNDAMSFWLDCLIIKRDKEAFPERSVNGKWIFKWRFLRRVIIYGKKGDIELP